MRNEIWNLIGNEDEVFKYNGTEKEYTLTTKCIRCMEITVKKIKAKPGMTIPIPACEHCNSKEAE